MACGWQRHSKAIWRQQKNQSEMHDKLHYSGSNVRGLLMFADITRTYSELHWNCQPLCPTASKLFDYWIIKTGLSTIFSLKQFKWKTLLYTQKISYIKSFKILLLVHFFIFKRGDEMTPGNTVQTVIIHLRTWAVAVNSQAITETFLNPDTLINVVQKETENILQSFCIGFCWVWETHFL